MSNVRRCRYGMTHFLLCLALVFAAQAQTIGNFFHLSDVHYDPAYMGMYSPTTMCHNVTGKTNAASPTTGMYGRFACDAPASLVESTLASMQSVNPNPDFILVTGDWSAHKMEGDDVIIAIDTVAGMVNKYFPQTRILPVIGNNDLESDYVLPIGPTKWLTKLYSAWEPWLNQSQTLTFLQGGYYAVQTHTGMWVAVLNTIYYSKHWSDKTTAMPGSSPDPDPSGQFAWLEGLLQTATSRGEKVYLTAHIPPGFAYNDEVDVEESSQLWQEYYVNIFMPIVEEYANTIAGQLYGHVHRDTFRVYHSNDTNPVPISYALCASSVSPIKFNNPSFRYVLLGTGYAITDYQEYYLDLWSANTNNAANWQLGYSFQKAYNVPISAVGLDTLWSQVLFNDTISSDWVRRRTSFFYEGRALYACTMANTVAKYFNECAKNAYLD